MISDTPLVVSTDTLDSLRRAAADTDDVLVAAWLRALAAGEEARDGRVARPQQLPRKNR
jgi:hypothetical protein